MTAHPLLGVTLASRFVVDALMAGGGQAWVFRGRRLGIRPDAPPEEALVAIKVPRFPDQWERIRREGEALKAIRSIYVDRLVKRLELPTGEPALVLQWVPGQPLSQLVPSMPWSMEDILRVVEQVCRGLRDIHGAGYVMRDLGPQQVMLDRSGDFPRICIVDLGLRREMASEADLTAPGLVAGTPGFTAPEAILGKAVNGASDVYSVACLSWLLLSGKRPFAAASVEATHALQLVGEPGLPQVEPTIWASFERVLRRGMALSPLERQEDPMEFYQDFAQAYLGVSVEHII